MEKHLNELLITGRFIKKPEVKQTSTGIAVVSETIASATGYKQNDKSQTLFLKIEAWKSSAENIGKYFEKGDLITVRGKLVPEEWKTKDGETRKSVKLLVEEFYFCGKREKAQEPEEPQFVDMPVGEELPF